MAGTTGFTVRAKFTLQVQNSAGAFVDLTDSSGGNPLLAQDYFRYFKLVTTVRRTGNRVLFVIDDVGHELLNLLMNPPTLPVSPSQRFKFTFAHITSTTTPPPARIGGWKSIEYDFQVLDWKATLQPNGRTRIHLIGGDRALNKNRVAYVTSWGTHGGPVRKIHEIIADIIASSGGDWVPGVISTMRDVTCVDGEHVFLQTLSSDYHEVWDKLIELARPPDTDIDRGRVDFFVRGGKEIHLHAPFFSTFAGPVYPVLHHTEVGQIQFFTARTEPYRVPAGYGDIVDVIGVEPVSSQFIYYQTTKPSQQNKFELNTVPGGNISTSGRRRVTVPYQTQNTVYNYAQYVHQAGKFYAFQTEMYILCAPELNAGDLIALAGTGSNIAVQPLGPWLCEHVEHEFDFEAGRFSTLARLLGGDPSIAEDEYTVSFIGNTAARIELDLPLAVCTEATAGACAPQTFTFKVYLYGTNADKNAKNVTLNIYDFATGVLIKSLSGITNADGIVVLTCTTSDLGGFVQDTTLGFLAVATAAMTVSTVSPAIRFGMRHTAP